MEDGSWVSDEVDERRVAHAREEVCEQRDVEAQEFDCVKLLLRARRHEVRKTLVSEHAGRVLVARREANELVICELKITQITKIHDVHFGCIDSSCEPVT